MTQPTIRPAEREDATLLSWMSTVTFYDAYEHSTTKANMSFYVDTFFNEFVITDEIESRNHRYFIVFVEEEPAAYVKIGDSHKPEKLSDQKALEIERIYVLNKFQGNKIGLMMMDFCRKFAEENSFEWLWLCVWNENKKAIGFYKNYGFENFDTTQFKLGEEISDDFLMKLKV